MHACFKYQDDNRILPANKRWCLRRTSSLNSIADDVQVSSSTMNVNYTRGIRNRDVGTHDDSDSVTHQQAFSTSSLDVRCTAVADTTTVSTAAMKRIVMMLVVVVVVVAACPQQSVCAVSSSILVIAFTSSSCSSSRNPVAKDNVSAKATASKRMNEPNRWERSRRINLQQQQQQNSISSRIQRPLDATTVSTFNAAAAASTLSNAEEDASAEDGGGTSNLDSVIMDAIVLHYRVSQMTPSCVWMQEQLQSIIDYGMKCQQRQQHNSNTSYHELELRIAAINFENAIVATNTETTAAANIQDQYVAYRQIANAAAAAGDTTSTAAYQVTPNCVQNIEHRLDAIERMILEVSSSEVSPHKQQSNTDVIAPTTAGHQQQPLTSNRRMSTSSTHSIERCTTTTSTKAMATDTDSIASNDSNKSLFFAATASSSSTTRIQKNPNQSSTTTSPVSRSDDRVDGIRTSSRDRDSGANKSDSSDIGDTEGIQAQKKSSGEDTRNDSTDDDIVVDVVIVGAGLGGLCAGAILNTIYNKTVHIYESHYIAGGCAHAFDRTASIPARNGKAQENVSFTFDSGPTILLGSSSRPYNALRQVLDAVNQKVEWIPYNGWGMIENPGNSDNDGSNPCLRWKCELGPKSFEDGPLLQYGGMDAVKQFKELQEATKSLMVGATIPAMAMRCGKFAAVPLLKYFSTLFDLIRQGDVVTGTFAPFMDGPIYTVTNAWLRNWLDALAFSLSGLPASRTAAAAMAYILTDMHREGAALDYPKGGMGAIVDALVRGVEQQQGTDPSNALLIGDKNSSRVHLRRPVLSIDCNDDGTRITGVTLKNKQRVLARDGVICNAPVWALRKLVASGTNTNADKLLANLDSQQQSSKNSSSRTTATSKDVFIPPSSWKTTKEGSSINPSRNPAQQQRNSPTSSDGCNVLESCDTTEMTGSFIHLHLAIDSTNLDMDALEAHYTVMDRGLGGDSNRIVNGIPDGPCGEANMIAVSNPCRIDPTLAPPGYIVVHAYGAGNEPYEIWNGLDRASNEYKALKEERAKPLWRAVESIIPDVRDRVVYEMIGSPLTHERFLRRPRGTYGSATEDYRRDGSIPGYDSLVLANDGIFPGIGVPAVAIAGAAAANSFVKVRDMNTNNDNSDDSQSSGSPLSPLLDTEKEKDKKESPLEIAMNVADVIRRYDDTIQDKEELVTLYERADAFKKIPGVTHGAAAFVLLLGAFIPTRRFFLRIGESGGLGKIFPELVVSPPLLIGLVHFPLSFGAVMGSRRYIQRLASVPPTVESPLVDTICNDSYMKSIQMNQIGPERIDAKSFDPRMQMLESLRQALLQCQSRREVQAGST